MSLNEIALAAAESHTWAGVNPYVVALVVLALFLGMLAMLISFGTGREHS